MTTGEDETPEALSLEKLSAVTADFTDRENRFIKWLHTFLFTLGDVGPADLKLTALSG